MVRDSARISGVHRAELGHELIRAGVMVIVIIAVTFLAVTDPSNVPADAVVGLIGAVIGSYSARSAPAGRAPYRADDQREQPRQTGGPR